MISLACWFMGGFNVPRIGAMGKYCPKMGFGGLGVCYMITVPQFEVEFVILRSSNESNRWRITSFTHWRGNENPIVN